MRELGKICEYLEEHLGEKMYLNQMCQDINKIVTRKKRMTKRELAFAINRNIKGKLLNVDRTPPLYKFEPIVEQINLSIGDIEEDD